MEPNCVHYLVYFDDAPSADDSTLLETRKEEVHEFSNWIVQRKLVDKKNAAPLTQAEHPPRGEDDDEEEEEEEVKEWYCWHRERFQLDVAYCEDAKRWCLKGQTRFGDAMDDEWMLVFHGSMEPDEEALFQFRPRGTDKEIKVTLTFLQRTSC